MFVSPRVERYIRHLVSPLDGWRWTGLLRISDEVEEVGLDAAKHSPAKAYSLTGGGATEKWAEKTPGPV